VLDETDFATHANWDVTGDVDDSGGNAAFTFAAGSLNGTLKQVNADQASNAANSNPYYFDYTVSVTTAPDGDFALVITGGAGEIPNVSVSLPITPGRHRVGFLSHSASATGDFTITASETTATQGQFTIDDVSLKKITDIDGWDKGSSYWPYLYTPNGIYNGSQARESDSHIIEVPSSAYTIYQEFDFKPNTTYRLDVEVSNQAAERCNIAVRYYTGAAWSTLRDYDVGNLASAQEQKKISVYFTLSAAEAAYAKTSIWFRQDTGEGRFYNPRLYDCGDFSYAENDGQTQAITRYFDVAP